MKNGDSEYKRKMLSIGDLEVRSERIRSQTEAIAQARGGSRGTPNAMTMDCVGCPTGCGDDNRDY